MYSTNCCRGSVSVGVCRAVGTCSALSSAKREFHPSSGHCRPRLRAPVRELCFQRPRRLEHTHPPSSIGRILALSSIASCLNLTGLDIRRIKNRFHRTYDAAEKSAGHRDLQLNICIPGTGLIWELQIHLAA